MSVDRKLAVVTGANRGIGKEIARTLASQGVKVILTARDPGNGSRVESEFIASGLDVVFHELDVTSESSIQTLADFVEREYKKLDILINNAGIGGNASVTNTSIPDFRKTLETNFYGPLMMSKAFARLLEAGNGGRIVNVSSSLGALKGMSGGYAAYRISKTALNALTAIMAAESTGKIIVNTMDPGWVKTDMGGSSAPRTVAQGAETAVWLALEKNIPSGKFFRDKKIVDW